MELVVYILILLEIFNFHNIFMTKKSIDRAFHLSDASILCTALGKIIKKKLPLCTHINRVSKMFVIPFKNYCKDFNSMIFLYF